MESFSDLLSHSCSSVPNFRARSFDLVVNLRLAISHSIPFHFHGIADSFSLSPSQNGGNFNQSHHAEYFPFYFPMGSPIRLLLLLLFPFPFPLLFLFLFLLQPPKKIQEKRQSGTTSRRSKSTTTTTRQGGNGKGKRG